MSLKTDNRISNKIWGFLIKICIGRRLQKIFESAIKNILKYNMNESAMSQVHWMKPCADDSSFEAACSHFSTGDSFAAPLKPCVSSSLSHGDSDGCLIESGSSRGIRFLLMTHSESITRLLTLTREPVFSKTTTPVPFCNPTRTSLLHVLLRQVFSYLPPKGRKKKWY